MIRAGSDRSGRPGRATKAAHLIRLAATNPIELYDRVRARLEVTMRHRYPTQARYRPISWDGLTQPLTQSLGNESPLHAFEHEFEGVYHALTDRARSLTRVPFPVLFDADPVLARLSYILTRALKPEVTMETGVALGIVSSCILAALDRNGSGRLISVDLPPLGVGSDAVGRLVPDALRFRWTLVRGSGTRVLRRLGSAGPPVGLFVQDSLFTWRNSTEEYSQILPALAARSAIVANCVQHSRAFAWLLEQGQPSMSATVMAEQKPHELIGVWLRAGSGSLEESVSPRPYRRIEFHGRKYVGPVASMEVRRTGRRRTAVNGYCNGAR